MLDTLDAGYWTLELGAGDRILELVTWILGVLDAEDTGCRRYWMPKILDTGDIGYWRYWMLETMDAEDAGCWCWRCVLLYYRVLVPLVNTRVHFCGYTFVDIPLILPFPLYTFNIHFSCTLYYLQLFFYPLNLPFNCLILPT